MRDVEFLIERVLGEKVVRYAILDGILIFYAGPSEQHQIVVGRVTTSVRDSLRSVSAPFADIIDGTGASGVSIADGELQPDASWTPPGRTKPTVVLEVGWSRELGHWTRDCLLNKAAKYLGLQENHGAGDEAFFSLSEDVVHAVIVVKLYGGTYAAANANGGIGLLAFLVTRAGVSERIQLGAVGADPWEPVRQFCTQFFGRQADMGIVTDDLFPPTRVGPILNVPLRTFVGFERADAIVFFSNQDNGDYPFFARISEWLGTEGNRLDTGNIQMDFYLA
jgi:hypothetical protein